MRHNFAPQGKCDNGRHEIESTSPFGLTVWGWGSAETGDVGIGFYTQYVSYAYPAGAGVSPINTVVVTPARTRCDRRYPFGSWIFCSFGFRR